MDEDADDNDDNDDGDDADDNDNRLNHDRRTAPLKTNSKHKNRKWSKGIVNII